ncbi:MAG: hypothetical protein QW815_08895 [Nitrososphaerota archaeon]
MSLHLSLELRLLFASPIRIAVPLITPLAPLLLRYVGLLGQDVVEPLFLLTYQFLVMTYLPWMLGLIRGGWRLVWLLGPPSSVLLLTSSYLGFLALTSALPLAAYRLLLHLSTFTPFDSLAVSLIIFTLSIGMLHHSLAALLLSRLRDMTTGWAAVLTYQSLLLILTASLLSQGWSYVHTAATPFFPALLAMKPQTPLEVLSLAAGLCLIFSLVFTYLTVRGVVRPPPS